jgi:predicted porin
MNKKLMALAVAGAVTAPGLALAQGPSLLPTAGVASNAGITFYGRLDEAIMYDKFSNAGNTAITDFKKGDIFSAGNAMGFRGREDLGGGTSAWFQLEIGVWPDARMEPSATTGNNWGGRNSGIGITSGLGDIMMGVWDTPYKTVYGVWNSLTSGGFSAGGVTMGMADSTGALNNALCTNTVNNGTGNLASTSANAVCVTEATISATAWSRRVNNSVQYWSPVMGGLQFKLMTTMANYQSPSNTSFASGLPNPKEYSANATWARGPISVGLGYDFHQGLRPNTNAGANANPKDTGVQLGAKWSFGMGEIGAGVEQLSYENNAASNAVSNGMDVQAYVLNGRLNVGPGAIWASYSGTDPKKCGSSVTVIGTAACGVKVKEYSLGYDYILSKRTRMYIAYNKIDNGFHDGVGSTYYYIAGPAGNAGNGTSSAIAPGTDVTTYAFGIQHLF